MSRVGKNPIRIPSGVKLTVAGQKVSAEGPQGKLSHVVHSRIAIAHEGDTLRLTRSSDSPEDKSLHGTNRAIVANMVHGVSQGFTRELEIVGVGYRGEQKGKGIQFLLGYSHPIAYTPPEGVNIKMNGANKVVVSGPSKQGVGQVAATIRGYRRPEPYKGKGVRYSDELLRRKEVKKS